jgi:hypothetical protein
MLNSPWIDPRDVDWTDAMNPLRNPGWAKNNNPFVYRALNEDGWYQGLRFAGGIEPRIYVGPEPLNQLVQPGQTVNYEVPIEPNFWLWGIVASGDGTDFLFNISDSETGAQLFSTPVSMATQSAIRNGTAGRGPIQYLQTPHLFSPPSYPIIKIINVANAAQVCHVTLYGCVEYDL